MLQIKNHIEFKIMQQYGEVPIAFIMTLATMNFHNNIVLSSTGMLQ